MNDRGVMTRWHGDEELARLASAMCAGTATEADRDHLERMLANPLARRAYRLSMQVHADLVWRWHASRQRGVTPVTVPPPAKPPGLSEAAVWLRACVAAIASRTTPPVVWITLLVGLAAGFAIIGQFILVPASFGHRATIDFGTSSGSVVALHEAVWQEGSPKRQRGEMLDAGTPLALARGLAEIALPCGATVILQETCNAVIESGASMVLTRGRLTATLDARKNVLTRRSDGPLFTVGTPTAVITDRGTRFGVAVDATGRTDVHVFEGLVDLASRSLPGATPLRLAAGEVATADATGDPGRIASSPAGRFVTAMPPVARSRPERLPGGIVWDDTRSVTLVRDSFSGSGPLTGSTPASRGGIGSAAWTAPVDGWNLGGSGSGVNVTGPGAASLPFRPEPGLVYRLSVTMNVTAGGNGWAALGFTVQPDTAKWTLDHTWMLQRHDVRSSDTSVLSLPNVAYTGPGQTGRVGDGDQLTGVRTRTILLDTSGTSWRALFLVGTQLVGESRFAARPEVIRHVALSVFPGTSVTFQNFSLQSLLAPRSERQ